MPWPTEGTTPGHCRGRTCKEERKARLFRCIKRICGQWRTLAKDSKGENWRRGSPLYVPLVSSDTFNTSTIFPNQSILPLRSPPSASCPIVSQR
jgi:hypothetical protein